jgi:hypothetical protein
MKKKISVILLVGTLMLTSCAVAVGDKDSTSDVSEQSQDESATDVVTMPAPVVESESESETEQFVPTFGDSFGFDGFNVSIGNELDEFKIVDNQFSEHDGKNIVVLPITVTNVSNDIRLFNSMYMTIYAPDGTQTKHFGILFMADDVFGVGKMMAGGTATTSIHFEYKGDGDYFIEFNNMNVSGIAKIPVKKESV